MYNNNAGHVYKQSAFLGVPIQQGAVYTSLCNVYSLFPTFHNDSCLYND